MRVLSIGSGTQLFNKDCEDRKRLQEYGEFVETLDLLLSCCRNFNTEKISINTTLNPTNSKYKLLRFFDILILGDKLIRQKNIDLIISQDPLINGFCAWLLSKKNKTKLMVSVFGTSVFDKYWRKEKWINIFLVFIGKLVMRSADLIQVDSLGNYEIIKNKYGKKVFYKPIIPSDIESYKTDKKFFLEDQIRILFVGRMAKQKNIKMLRNIIKIINTKSFIYKIKFTIIGSGPEKYLLDGLGGLNNVFFIDTCNREELKNQYKNNDILILTSYYEGFPRVFMEAAINGLPIVTTNVSGAKNAIEDGKSGFIVENNNLNDFVLKLEELINNRNMLVSFSNKILDDFNKNYNYQTTISIQKQIFNYLENIK
ncbi:MAG: glycosyltransferase [Patescibacteria group bacterium]|nr:glycosyltransferase [Patescibacteria group bacterium]